MMKRLLAATNRDKSNSSAAVPPDVRKGCAFPIRILKRIYTLARLSLANVTELKQELSGRPEAFRTSDGIAEIKFSDATNLDLIAQGVSPQGGP